MVFQTADWGGMGMLILFLFVILPSIRWSIGAGVGGRRRRHPFRWSFGEWSDGASSREIEALRSELESKLAEVDTLSSRVAELENRLDFTERLLTQQSNPSFTTGHQTPSP